MRLALFAITGSLGAMGRYWLSGQVQQRSNVDFPLGTLAVNLTGAVAIGLVAGAGWGETTSTALIGFLGGYTTFSTWMIETLRLGLPELRARSVLNLALTLVLGVGATAVAYSLTGA